MLDVSRHCSLFPVLKMTFHCFFVDWELGSGLILRLKWYSPKKVCQMSACNVMMWQPVLHKEAIRMTIHGLNISNVHPKDMLSHGYTRSKLMKWTHVFGQTRPISVDNSLIRIATRAVTPQYVLHLWSQRWQLLLDAWKKTSGHLPFLPPGTTTSTLALSFYSVVLQSDRSLHNRGYREHLSAN